MWEEKYMYVGNNRKVIMKQLKIWVFSESHIKIKMTNFQQKQGFGHCVQKFYNTSSQVIYTSWFLARVKNLQLQKHTASFRPRRCNHKLIQYCEFFEVFRSIVRKDSGHQGWEAALLMFQMNVLSFSVSGPWRIPQWVTYVGNSKTNLRLVVALW